MSSTRTTKRTDRAKDRNRALIEEARNQPVAFQNTWIQGRRYPSTINAGRSMTITETKILMYIVSKIKPTDTEFAPQEFNLRNFCEVCGIGGQQVTNCYSHLKSAVKRLADRSEWLKKPDGKETLVRIIQKVELDTIGTGCITIILDNDMAPYLLELKKNYTVFPLREILRMKSKYGIVLYELLKSLSYMGKPIVFDLQELKEKLDCTNYTSTYNFKVKVIEPAINDINTYSSLKVEDVVYEKKGRAVSKVVFYVKNLETSQDAQDVIELNQRVDTVNAELYEADQYSLFDGAYGTVMGAEAVEAAGICV